MSLPERGPVTDEPAGNDDRDERPELMATRHEHAGQKDRDEREREREPGTDQRGHRDVVLCRNVAGAALRCTPVGDETAPTGDQEADRQHGERRRTQLAGDQDPPQQFHRLGTAPSQGQRHGEESPARYEATDDPTSRAALRPWRIASSMLM